MFFNSEGFIAGILPTSQAAYYCRDAQGNITSVWRVDAGYPYQSNFYYADGLLKNNSTSTSFQPYLYSAKELVKMHGYDCYDYGARHSQAALGRFTSPDPLAEKFYDTSPYVLCGGNPVRYVDPDGRDIWEINSTGEVVSRTTNTNVDRFEFVNADGSKTGIQFKYGVVEDTRSQKVKDQSMDVYKIRGDENAKSLYEFFVDGTSENAVEWSWFETGIEGDNGLNFISTSHEKGKDSSATELFENQLSNGYTIRSHTHNHPSGYAIPSNNDKIIFRWIGDYATYNGVKQPKFFIYSNQSYVEIKNY